MNTSPSSIYAPSELARTTRSAESTGAIHGVLSMIAKVFNGIADQRDRQAKQIIAQYGQTSWSDWLERKIDDAASGN